MFNHGVADDVDIQGADVGQRRSRQAPRCELQHRRAVICRLGGVEVRIESSAKEQRLQGAGAAEVDRADEVLGGEVDTTAWLYCAGLRGQDGIATVGGDQCRTGWGDSHSQHGEDEREASVETPSQARQGG